MSATIKRDAKWWADLPRDRFGDKATLSNQLLQLVLEGKKTASCCAQVGPVHLKPGARFVIEDGAGAPRCVIEMTSIEPRAFNEVNAEFAKAEGEGDLSLAHWRRVHEDFFRRTTGFKPDMTVLCERFKVVEVIAPDVRP